MGDVLDLGKAREENLPHEIFEAICVKCYKRFICVSPVGTLLKDLECSGCGETGYIIKTGQPLE